jgi:hypothetical protein
MKKTTPMKKAARFPHRIVTTLGDLIAAAYDVAGPSPRRTERAAALLTRSPLARAMSRHLELSKA